MAFIASPFRRSMMMSSHPHDDAAAPNVTRPRGITRIWIIRSPTKLRRRIDQAD
jgi:hypothetical protein